MKEIGQELFQVKNHKEQLTGIAISTSIDKGNLHVFLSKLPMIGSAYQSRVASLTSLLEVTIASAIEQGQTWTISADIEHSFMALGPYHMALGMNNRVWFYVLNEMTVEFLKDKEYLGTVQEIFLNGDYCAVRFDGKVQLHVLEGEGQHGEVSEDRESKIFPEAGRNDVISCHALTPDFLVLGTDRGGVTYFYLEDWTMVQELRHNTGVKELIPEPNGTKSILVDVKSQGYIYNPVNDEVTLIRDFPDKCKKLIWDSSVTDKDVFIAFDGDNMHTYLVKPDDVEGATCTCLGQTSVPAGQQPILLFGGEVSLQTQSGSWSRPRSARTRSRPTSPSTPTRSS